MKGYTSEKFMKMIERNKWNNNKIKNKNNIGTIDLYGNNDTALPWIEYFNHVFTYYGRLFSECVRWNIHSNLFFKYDIYV